MYPVQYLRNKTTTGVPGPRLTVKLVGTMVQDLVKKKTEGKEKQCTKGKQTNPHAIKKKKIIRSSLETQTLRNSFETQKQIYAKKKVSSVQAKEKIETYTNCLYISKPTRKRGRKGKLGHKAGQQRTIWENSRDN